MTVTRAIVEERVLDTLIRAKLATLEHCKAVQVLPVKWREPDASGSNWTVSGWSGETAAVMRCVEEMESYLQFLFANFLVPGRVVVSPEPLPS